MAAHQIPVVHFVSGQRKDDIVAPYRARFSAREGVVVLGVVQEKMRSFKAHKRTGPGPRVTFDFSRQSVAVNHYYFYVHDRDWGPAFLKIGTYLPYPVKLCLNGHEWVKQQLRRAHIAFESLDNGFLSCAAPARLQTIADRLGLRRRPGLLHALFPTAPLATDSPSAGNKFSLETLKPEQPDIRDKYYFRIEGAKISNSEIAQDMNRIRVVPNPYVVSSLWEPEFGELRREPLRQIQFINLPPVCTIYIFTVDADLIKTIYHSSTNGTEVWDLRAEGGREIAAGVYIYLVKTQDTEHLERFAVIK